MNPTFQKKFKVICQDEPYFPKKMSKLFVKMHPTSQKNFKVIRRDEQYFPK